MNIVEMHVWFRQYAQQMGMQNVRAILPEQIDNLINTSTLDVIDELVHNNVGTTNDRVISDNAKLSTVNALRTLYKVKTVPIGLERVTSFTNNPIRFNSDLFPNSLYFVDFAIKYSDNSNVYEQLYNGYDNYKYALDLYNKLKVKTNKAQNYNVFINFSTAFNAFVSWIDSNNLNIPHSGSDSDIGEYIDLTSSADSITLEEGPFTAFVETTFKNFVETVSEETVKLYDGTRLFPIRVINEAYLADILNDYVLAPRVRTPIMAIYSDDNTETSAFEVYLGENDDEAIAGAVKNLYVYQIRCSYIKKPNKVRYVSDLGGSNVNSDLPEQLQIPMLKHAVDLYRSSIRGDMFAAQQANQNQQQELVRNNARPDNDGYQS